MNHFQSGFPFEISLKPASKAWGESVNIVALSPVAL